VVTPGQAAVEERAGHLRGAPVAPGQTCAQVYGPLEDWFFRLGPWQFFLEPVSGRWLFLDPVHGQYRDTGYGAGQVAFRLEGQVWVAEPLDPGTAPREPARWCRSCGQIGAPDARFCRSCGRPIGG